MRHKMHFVLQMSAKLDLDRTWLLPQRLAALTQVHRSLQLVGRSTELRNNYGNTGAGEGLFH